MHIDPDGNTCQSCGGVPDICFRPVDYGDGTGEAAVILCRKCVHPDELEDYAIVRQTRIYQPEGATHFSVEETDWLYLTEDLCMPAQMQHRPTSCVFQLDMDIPEGAETFYPVRSIYAVLAHVCAGRSAPGGDELLRIAREALTLWLMDAGYMAISSHVDKAAVPLVEDVPNYSGYRNRLPPENADSGITDEDIPF